MIFRIKQSYEAIKTVTNDGNVWPQNYSSEMLLSITILENQIAIMERLSDLKKLEE